MSPLSVLSKEAKSKMAAAAILQFDPLDRSVTLQSVHSNDLLLSLTGAALWRMQLTFPYNTQLGAVPYRMVIKQCISSTFAVHWLFFSWHFFTASNSDYLTVRRRSRRTFSTHFEIFRRRFDGVVIYFFNSDFKFFDDASQFSVTSFYVVFIFS